MKWIKKNKYYIEHIGNGRSFSICKNVVNGETIYQLYKLPYNSAKLLGIGKDLNTLKLQAQKYDENKTI